jgi:cobalamin biosynthesis protein CobC
MAAISTIWHGGDLNEARQSFPDAPEPWIDLSTGINPIPYPLPDLPASVWQRLPGREAEAALMAAARAAYRVPEEAALAAAPGTQILIEMLPQLLGSSGTVAVLGPTYGEHARSWRKAGRRVVEVAALAEAQTAEIVVLVNPNNPDGRVIAPSELRRFAEGRARRGGTLVVDEAFADFDPWASIVPDLPPATVVLRSFGKAYGLAGLRLGFAIARGDLPAVLADRLGPWAVPGPALHVGALALADETWRAATALARAEDAGRLDRLLVRHGTVAGGTSLFRLLDCDAAGLFERLGRRGLYVRRFQDQPNRLRFGLPADEAAWARLEAALGD